MGLIAIDLMATDSFQEMRGMVFYCILTNEHTRLYQIVPNPGSHIPRLNSVDHKTKFRKNVKPGSGGVCL